MDGLICWARNVHPVGFEPNTFADFKFAVSANWTMGAEVPRVFSTYCDERAGRRPSAKLSGLGDVRILARPSAELTPSVADDADHLATVLHDQHRPGEPDLLPGRLVLVVRDGLATTQLGEGTTTSNEGLLSDKRHKSPSGVGVGLLLDLDVLLECRLCFLNGVEPHASDGLRGEPAHEIRNRTGSLVSEGPLELAHRLVRSVHGAFIPPRAVYVKSADAHLGSGGIIAYAKGLESMRFE